MYQKIIFPFLLVFGTFVQANAQESIKDEPILLTQISVHGGFHLPAAMMAQKFGSSFLLGGGVHVKNRKNIIFGAEYSYFFNETVKNREQYLQNMRTVDNMIIAKDGTAANILSGERGFIIQGNIGKIFPVIGPNINSGILIRIGIGYFQHKIHFEARKQDVPQIEGDMRQYYDQLTSGPTITQFIGYQHLSNSRLANFFIGIEGYQAFTQNRRDYNIDLNGPDKTQRLDMLFGARVGWMWLIYKRKPQDFYFN